MGLLVLPECSGLLYSDHALRAMVTRFIRTKEVEEVVKNGEIIKFYASDKPYPSYLLLKFVNGRPIHFVIAQKSEDGKCIVITCYEPTYEIWEMGFKQKR